MKLSKLCLVSVLFFLVLVSLEAQTSYAISLSPMAMWM